MKHFLYRIAETFFREHRHSTNQFTFVFPNRRAGLFYQQYLAEVATQPFFSPEIITIDQWFENASVFSSADKLFQLFKLYELFIQLSNSDESFDSFAFWGEIILNDFNEIDKYRVDASQLFQNVSDLKAIDEGFSFFSPEQIIAIRSFWSAFQPSTVTASQQEFLETWKVLNDLYSDFKLVLAKDMLAYEGMMMRDVADRMSHQLPVSWIEGKKFVFVGFNALNPCEKTIMQELAKRNQADFYWDYDAEALRDPQNPASRFYKDNTRLFPSQYSLEPQFRLLADKNIQLINVPSGVGQAKEAYNILRELYPDNNTTNSFLQTAVVLPDEKLLMPLLYSIPDNVHKVNVTMGYPLQLTPVAGLMEHIFELQRRKKLRGAAIHFYHQDVTNILNHQFIADIESELSQQLTNEITRKNKIYIDEEFLGRSLLFKTLFRTDVDVHNFLSYLKDSLLVLYRCWKLNHTESSRANLQSGFLYQYFSTVNRLQDILKQQVMIESLQVDTLIRIIKELTSNINIPFVGEPLDGLQVMGVLETRGLDFKNIVICSFNEGIYPRKSYTNSFIPYHLRKGFELPTYEQLDAITAYNFYRLIHHAENIFLLNDTRTESGTTGEVSRFFYQLKYYYNLDIPVKSTSANVSVKKTPPLHIAKDKRLLDILSLYTEKGTNARALSASSLDLYIRCPMQFCLSVLENVIKTDEVTEKVENDVFGTIFHAVVADLYAPFTGREISTDVIKGLLINEPMVEKLLTQAFSMHFFKLPKGTIVELEGSNLLIANVLKKYITGVLKQDLNYAPFTYTGGELNKQATLPTCYGNVNLKGYIDRVDLKDGTVRILDYKTGNGELEFNSWDAIFDHSVLPKNRPKYVLQTFLYGYLFKNHTEHNVICPGIYYTRKLFSEQFSTVLSYKNEQKETISISNYHDFEGEYLPRLIGCVEEILNPDIPFFQTEFVENCTYCDYKSICRR
jgi:hypothetical protein